MNDKTVRMTDKTVRMTERPIGRRTLRPRFCLYTIGRRFTTARRREGAKERSSLARDTVVYQDRTLSDVFNWERWAISSDGIGLKVELVRDHRK